MSKSRVPAMPAQRKRPQAPRTRKTTRQRPTLSRNAMFAIALGGAALIAAVLIGVSLLGGKESSSSAATPGEQLPTITAAALEDLKGIPQNGLVLGKPGAKATIVEYGDLQCPACASFASSSFPTVVERFVATGRAKLEFRGMDFVGPDSTRALRFVHAAGEQGKAWSVISLLYANQGAERSGWVTDDMIRAISNVIGLDPEAMVDAASSTRYAGAIAKSDAQARADGVSVTPSFLVVAPGGQKSAIIEGAQPPDAFTAPLEAATTG
jgi:protein-disulfide isomerase